jgi:transposase InsO family protein
VPINDCCHIDHTACNFDVGYVSAPYMVSMTNIKPYTKRLKDLGITISMDGKGRATDNSCIERFWRSAKCERIYLNEYQSISELITDEHPKKPSLFLDLILYFFGAHPLVFYMPVFHGIFYGYKTQYNHLHQ